MGEIEARSGRSVEAFVMQPKKVARREREGGVTPASVVTELHFENSRSENLYNGAHLSADQASIRHIAHQCDDRKQFEIGHLPSFL